MRATANDPGAAHALNGYCEFQAGVPWRSLGVGFSILWWVKKKKDKDNFFLSCAEPLYVSQNCLAHRWRGITRSNEGILFPSLLTSLLRLGSLLKILRSSRKGWIGKRMKIFIFSEPWTLFSSLFILIFDWYCKSFSIMKFMQTWIRTRVRMHYGDHFKGGQGLSELNWVRLKRSYHDKDGMTFKGVSCQGTGLGRASYLPCPIKEQTTQEDFNPSPFWHQRSWA